MDRQELNQRLSQLSTQWTMLLQAHAGAADAVTAQTALLQRYGGAVYRYLLGALKDADTAEELSQEFAYRFLRGGFRRANPERGRFRDYVKTALIHLVTDYHNERRSAPHPLTPEMPEPAAPSEPSLDTERDFLQSWQDELLARAWKALAAFNSQYEATLLLRVENPDLASAQIAEQLTSRFGKPISAAWVRKALQRSHEKFADLLLEEVACSLEAPTPGDLEAELRALDLLKYCRQALERRGPKK